MLRILHFSNISMLPVLKLVSFDILNLVCGILILGRQLVCVISMQSILKTLGFFSSGHTVFAYQCVFVEPLV